MSQRAQRLSGIGLDGDARGGARPRAVAGDTLRARQTTVGATSSGGNRKSRGRGAARHLQVDEAVAHAVAPDGLAHHARPGAASLIGWAMRSSPSERASRCHVPRLVDQPAVAHLAHLIDGVGELEAAILDVHARPRA